MGVHSRGWISPTTLYYILSPTNPPNHRHFSFDTMPPRHFCQSKEKRRKKVKENRKSDHEKKVLPETETLPFRWTNDGIKFRYFSRLYHFYTGSPFSVLPPFIFLHLCTFATTIANWPLIGLQWTLFLSAARRWILLFSRICTWKLVSTKNVYTCEQWRFF